MRPLIVQNNSTIAAHEAAPGERVTVEELLALYSVDETLTAKPVHSIGIVDDVLTAGTHYRAMHTVSQCQVSGYSDYWLIHSSTRLLKSVRRNLGARLPVKDYGVCKSGSR